MNRPFIVRALCMVAFAMLHVGCSTLRTGPSQGLDGVTQAMRSHPDQYILVTLRNEPAPFATRAGSTPRGYDAAARYAVSARASSVARALSSAYGLREVRSWPIPALGVHCVVFELPSGTNREAILAQLEHEPDVHLAQPLQTFVTAGSEVAYNDPYLDLQRSLQLMAIPAAHRWSRGRGIRIAVIDTGIDTRHPELAGRIRESRNFVDSDDTRFERDRHGTEVAGLIAALAGNREGIVGVAPEVEIIALKACWQLEPVSDAAVCNSFTLAQGIAAAIASGAHVINLSVAGPDDPILQELVSAAIRNGVVVVGAVAPPAAAKLTAPQGFPASVPGVIAVDVTQPQSSPSRHIYAPGNDIFTLAPDGGYGFASGSSLAAAQVSGVVALLLSRQRSLSGDEVRALLSGATERVSTPHGELASLNACAALAAMLREGPCPVFLLTEETARR